MGEWQTLGDWPYIIPIFTVGFVCGWLYARKRYHDSESFIESAVTKALEDAERALKELDSPEIPERQGDKPEERLGG